MFYNDLSRKEKQLLASQYPYKSDGDLFNKNDKNIISGMYTKKDLEDFKREAEKEGVSLTKKTNFIKKNNRDFSIIDSVLAPMGEDQYRAALELAKINFEPSRVLKDLFAIESTRLRRGIEYEQAMDLGLSQETQQAMNSLVNITKTINDIENGQQVDVRFSNNLAGLISDIDFDDIGDDYEDDDNYIDVDYHDVDNE